MFFFTNENHQKKQIIITIWLLECFFNQYELINTLAVTKKISYELQILQIKFKWITNKLCNLKVCLEQGLTAQKVSRKKTLFLNRIANTHTRTHIHTHTNREKQITYFPSLLFFSFKEKVMIFFVHLRNRTNRLK